MRKSRENIYLSLAILFLISLLCIVSFEIWNIPLFQLNSINYEKLNSWSTFVSSVATALAVIVSLASWYWQRSSQFVVEEKRRIETETSVFQYLVVSDLIDESDDSFIGRIWYLYIQNQTSAPIYNWLVEFDGNIQHLCSKLERPLLPGENKFRLYELDDIEPNQAPKALLIFESKVGDYWLKSPEGRISQSDPNRLNCEHSQR